MRGVDRERIEESIDTLRLEVSRMRIQTQTLRMRRAETVNIINSQQYNADQSQWPHKVKFLFEVELCRLLIATQDSNVLRHETDMMARETTIKALEQIIDDEDDKANNP